MPAWLSLPIAMSSTGRSRGPSLPLGRRCAARPAERTSRGCSGAPTPRLICSLVQKFGRRDVGNFDRFVQASWRHDPVRPVGELFVFVDECHRTQSGRLQPHYEGHDAGRGVHWLHWHAAIEEGQANQLGGLRQLHPYLQVQRGRGRRASCSISSTRRGTSIKSWEPGQDRRLVRRQDEGPQRLAKGRAPQDNGARCSAC